MLARLSNNASLALHRNYLTQRLLVRHLAYSASDAVKLRRSYLYVPSSSQKMLDKSLSTPSDTIIYDLEDSVSIPEKDSARARLANFLKEDKGRLQPNRIAVRLNDITTPFFQDDIAMAASSWNIRTLVLPKIHSIQDLQHVERAIQSSERPANSETLQIIASVESARALWNLGDISQWTSKTNLKLTALLFAAEDFCADTSIIRTPSRQELLYARSKVVSAAKAFKLHAIDMVCVNYQDLNYLKEECQDGRRLGFDGKQAIHPKQVETIQATFVPTSEEVMRAAKIVHTMQLSKAGAFGLDRAGGGKEMIDAPMLKQAEKTLQIAQAAGVTIPTFE